VRLIVSRLVARKIQVMHMKEEALRARWHAGPSHRRRSAFAGRNTRGSLTELNGNLTAIRKSWNR